MGAAKEFLFGKPTKPLEKTEVRQQGDKARKRGADAGARGRDRAADVRRTAGETGKVVAGGASDISQSRTQLQQQRQLTAALTGAVGDSGSLAALQAKQAQEASRGQLAAGQAAGGDLASILQAGNQQGLGLAGQAGEAAGQEAIGKEQQLARLFSQQRSADLGQQGLGQDIALGGFQNALAGQQQLFGAANEQERLARSDAFEREKLQLLADLRHRDALQGQARRPGLLPGMLAGAGSVVGGIYGGPGGAAAGGKAGEGLGTAFTASRK